MGMKPKQVTGSPRQPQKALSALFVRQIAVPGRYSDGNTLHLLVQPNGAKSWVQRLTIAGKRHDIGLGGANYVTLAEAREKAAENRRLARAGGDPLAAKRKPDAALTFSQAVDRYLETKLAEFRSDKHRKQWRATLDGYAAPMIGSKAVDTIQTQDVLRVLQPIWTGKTETASRLRGRIEAVLSWATVSGHRAGDNPARWGGNLKELLPAPGKISKEENHPALALADVARWWRDLQTRDGMGAEALRFITLTLARSGEVRGMTWDEVDLGRALWTVPAARMKMRREHRVPLTPEAVVLLEQLPRLNSSAFVFFAPQGGALSDMSISAVMRRMQAGELARLAKEDAEAGRGVSTERRGYIDTQSKRAAVPHGLRSTFRTWAAEMGLDRDMSEIALAHKVGGEVERAYMRSDMLERRRAMLVSWVQFVRG